MNIKSIKKSFIGTAVGLMMMFGVTVATANAQYRDYDQYRNYDNSRSWTRERTQDYAFKLGYHSAYSEANEARNNGFRGSPRDLTGYRNDGNGYLAYMNYLQDYRASYRRGFEAGARDAFSGRERRYGRAEVEAALGQRLPDAYQSDDNYRDQDWRDRDRDWRDNGDRRNDWRNVDAIAQRNGYQDGVRRGEQDRFRRAPFGYQGTSEYRNAMNGYRFEFGNRDRYRESYREGFRRGYAEAFRRGDNRRPF